MLLYIYVIHNTTAPPPQWRCQTAISNVHQTTRSNNYKLAVLCVDAYKLMIITFLLEGCKIQPHGHPPAGYRPHVGRVWHSTPQPPPGYRLDVVNISDNMCPVCKTNAIKQLTRSRWRGFFLNCFPVVFLSFRISNSCQKHWMDI